MANIKKIHLFEINNQNLVLWSSANKPTQDMFGLIFSEVYLHLKSLYLLSETVVATASFFYESKITRDIYKKLKRLFEKGEILFFTDDIFENFHEHGIMKIEKSPKELTSYNDRETVNRLSKELDSLGYLLHRPSVSISDRIVDVWISELLSSEYGSLGFYLQKSIKNNQKLNNIRNKLIDFAKTRKKSFVWEYIRPFLIQLNLPKQFLKYARIRLSQIYSFATASILGSATDRVDFSIQNLLIDSNHKFDSSIFLNCMEILGAKKQIFQLSAKELTILKYSQEFTIFKQFYFDLLEATEYRSIELKKNLPIYREAAQQYKLSEVTIPEFLKSFELFCVKVLKKNKQFSKPLDTLLMIYDTFNQLSIESFLSKLSSITNSHTQSKKNIQDYKPQLGDKQIQKNKKTIFISYAREDEKYKIELEKHLSGLKNNGFIETWSDRSILPGQEWDKEIKKQIDEADIILFLISADFMNSDYINDVEIKKAILRYQNSEVIIIPVIIRPCDLQSLEINMHSALPKDAKPVTDWRNKDKAFLSIVQGIKKIIL